ncbi:valine--tRNA ligase isoform X1 [Hydra vulgaris]|uniref:valine--tRNA ligase isoform X1 n=2 Tax=Hydra vulgaris TaxID=6087 RepID=UPI001F5E68A7|nr:valine--tRNA ligase isoform X1 [Hydra vulgaris]
MVNCVLNIKYIFSEKVSFSFFSFTKSISRLNCVNNYSQSSLNKVFIKIYGDITILNLNRTNTIKPQSLVLFRHKSQMDGIKDEDSTKTAAQLKKDAKKLAKLEKFAKKQESKPKSKVEEKLKPKKEVKKLFTYDISTAEGEKKNTNEVFPDAYSPLYVESCWYSWWEKKGFFKPEYNKSAHQGRFVIVIPPPNVTGNLHLGHGLTNSIEDCITRWHRMNGRTALWVPGCDHAGIATQVVVERKLKKDLNISRHDLGRDKFIEKVWEWKNTKGDRIYHQMRKMGISVDWDRVSFTMDEKLSTAVKEAFVRLHDKKLIYRSNRLVNWSCALNSAISDIEVDKKDISGRTLLDVPGYNQKIEFGVLIHFMYSIEGSDEKITVATTRIETMLGDTGIAVHPSDQRYVHLIGKYALHPFCNRKLAIVSDDTVDPTFGTGAVKVTPAHDHNDYEIGKRHNLPFINIFDESGLIKDIDDFKDEYKTFVKMKRFVARYEVLNALKSINMYIKTEDNAMVIPMCSRSKDIVEPLLIPQWYVDCKEMAAKAVQAVRNGDLKIIPQMHEKTWYQWMENCRDWCISRQLWWGHRIPAYFVTIDGQPAGPAESNDYWVSGRTKEEALEKAVERFKVTKEKLCLQQDEDVLDTWFSSALFPFSVFGWPEQTADLKAFYPTTLLETGHDILFFWVARMVMFGQELTGELPFKEVYLHAMVRDAYGRKMSKSLGNIIDPLDVITGISLQDLISRLDEYNLDPKELEKAKKGQKEMFPNGIPECGTDALRFALCAYTAQGRDVNLDVLRIQGYRHFCNKLWNATKFAMRNFTPEFVPKDQFELHGCESPMDKWILSRLSAAANASNEGFKTYDFPKCTTALYNFWLYDLCDLYLEAIKPVFYGNDENQKVCSQNVLYKCLDNGLRLLSPFMPYLTEELYQRLPHQKGSPESICVASYPSELPWSDLELETEVDKMMEVVKTIRSMKEEYVNTKAKPIVYLKPYHDEIKVILNKLKCVIVTLTNSDEMHILNSDEETPGGCAVQLIGDRCEVSLLLKGILDFKKEVEKMKIKQEKVEDQLKKLIENMNVDDYAIKVPEKVQQQNTEKVAQLSTELEKLKVALLNFTKEAAE